MRFLFDSPWRLCRSSPSPLLCKQSTDVPRRHRQCKSGLCQPTTDFQCMSHVWTNTVGTCGFPGTREQSAWGAEETLRAAGRFRYLGRSLSKLWLKWLLRKRSRASIHSSRHSFRVIGEELAHRKGHRPVIGHLLKTGFGFGNLELTQLLWNSCASCVVCGRNTATFMRPLWASVALVTDTDAFCVSEGKR